MKFFSEKGMRVKIQTECSAVETSALLKVDNHRLCVVLNWEARGSDIILTEVSKSQLKDEAPKPVSFLLIVHNGVALVVRVTRTRWPECQSGAFYGII